jgi:hypothetical protein
VSQSEQADSIWRPEGSLAALIRQSVAEPNIEPAYSMCSICGRRVDGTSKRKYCGRQCASRALLIRRRLARSRLNRAAQV